MRNTKTDIFLLTEDRYLRPKENNEYNRNILQEDEILMQALEKNNISSQRVSWSDSTIDFSIPEFLLFRTTWDYYQRFEAFKTWLDRIKNESKTINKVSTIYRNLDKKYLLELQEKGIKISETELLRMGRKVDFESMLSARQWERAIVKPCISAAARETYIVREENANSLSNHISKLLKNENFLFQIFEEQVLTRGELSLMYFGGQFTHAILKRAKQGDFRVQDDFGGTVEIYNASEKEIAFGQKVLEAWGEIPDYARVDLLWNQKDELVLSELELIEPELWFRFNPDSAMVFARLLKNKYFKNDI